MTSSAKETVQSDPLVRAYSKFVAEPESRTNAYGYWIFILGFAAGILGFLIYLSAQPTQFALKEIAFILASFALGLALLGIVLMLPIHENGVRVAIVGFIIAIAGIMWFTRVYPQSWLVGPRNATTTVILVYGLGIGIIAAVAVAVPLVTGKQSYFYESQTPEPEEEPRSAKGTEATDRSIIRGETRRGGLFAVFETDGTWTWRFVDERAIAGSGHQYQSDATTVDAIDTVKSLMENAGLLEFKHASFRLHEVPDEGWKWKFVDDHGATIATGGQIFDNRNGAEQSLGHLADDGPAAPLLNINGAAFDLSSEDGYWNWNLIDEDREPLMTGPGRFETRQNADSSMNWVHSEISAASILEFDEYGIEVANDGNGWYWRLLDGSTNEVAVSERRHEARSDAEAAVTAFLTNLEDAPVKSADSPAYEISPQQDNGWYWRVVTSSGDELARSHETKIDSETAQNSATEMQSLVQKANVYTIREAAIEVYPTSEDRWSWRLMDVERNELGESTPHYDDRENAELAADRLKQLVEDAEVIEFDKPAFQLYEDDGNWLWRLLDVDGRELTDSGDEYYSRDEAASAIPTLKEHAPDAELIEIDTAAFEVFRNSAQNWNWRLVTETGETIAQGRRMAESKQAARQAVDHFVERTLASEIVAMDRAAFHIHLNARDEWTWRFVRSDGEIFAMSSASYATQDEAEAAIDAFRGVSASADSVVVKEALIQIQQRNGDWDWRVVDRSRRSIVSSTEAKHDSRSNAVDEIENIRQHRGEIFGFNIDQATIIIRKDGEKWRWEIIDENWTVRAVSPDLYDSKQQAREVIERVRQVTPEADHFDFDRAAFETDETSDGWQWRLIDDNKQTMAKSADFYSSREQTTEAIEKIRPLVDDASVLEINSPVFEIYNNDDGWRWRLIDERESVLAKSTKAYSTPQDARDAMREVQEFGPTAPTTVANQAN